MTIQCDQVKMFSSMVQTTGDMSSTAFNLGILISDLLTIYAGVEGDEYNVNE